MNDSLIKQLANRAGCDYLYDYSDDGHAIVCNLSDIEKLVELVVKECARVARATPCPYTDENMRQQLGHTWDMASLESGREIIKHFGAN